MSGPNTQPSQQIGQEQLNLAEQQNAQSQQNYAQMQTYLKPAISFNQSIAGGNQQSLLTALAPQLTNLTKAQSSAKGQIMESVGPGAARDVALAQNDMNTQDQIANLKNTSYTSALDKLANIGSGLGSFSLNETGAALSGFSGASTTQNNVMQAQAASKASTMGFLGSLAGAAGTAAGGGAFGSLSDIRLKSDIKKVADAGPLSIYEYHIVGKPEKEVGFIAQEVEKILPDAVTEDKSGFLRVNYPSALAKLALMQAA